ncbi:MAG: alpha/beta hydrolase [Anaerolineaceae bacterium]|nr:alpha/beta hydrolase [Anaerolineaceae bacterium]
MGSQNKIPAPGQMVDVGGFRLHAMVSGQGAPCVLFEPGLGGFALQYSHIQAGVSAFTRVMSYDRAGQGWSDCSPNPRTPANLVGELRALLERLDLQPPYILVGHSFGGLLARFFAGFHPQEVAGIILVDASDVEQYDSFPNVDKLVSQAGMGVRLLKFASRLGLAKPVAKMSLGRAARVLPREDLDTFIAVASQPKHQETMLAEFSQHRCYFGQDAEVPRTLGDMPVAILTAGNSVSGQGKFGGMTIDQLKRKHQEWQKNLVQLSSQAEQIILPGATHLSILIQPEYVAQVVDAIRRRVERVRSENR